MRYHYLFTMRLQIYNRKSNIKLLAKSRSPNAETRVCGFLSSGGEHF